jgi:LL-diaminopimelate aminotransferase
VNAAQRLNRIPPYPFAALDRAAQEARARGTDVISLGIGDPDLAEPPEFLESVLRATYDAAHHLYPPYAGTARLRAAAAAHYARRFGVTLDPERQVLGLIGSKEGLAHLIWAMVDPGDRCLVPTPAYPVYRAQCLLAGGEPVDLPLRADRGFVPDLEAVPPQDLERARLLFVNYPNNPTGAVADLEFYRRAVAFCRAHDLLLVSDAAYVETVLDGPPPPSVLQVQGADAVAVEFYSLSKPFSLTGARVAVAVGNDEALAALAAVKANTDSGQWVPLQDAATELLSRPQAMAAYVAEANAVYRERRRRAVNALAGIGIDTFDTRATFYVWAKVPGGMDDGAFAARLVMESGVLVSPGRAFGDGGAGWFRISLTVDDDRLDEALERLARWRP